MFCCNIFVLFIVIGNCDEEDVGINKFVLVLVLLILGEIRLLVFFELFELFIVCFVFIKCLSVLMFVVIVWELFESFKEFRLILLIGIKVIFFGRLRGILVIIWVWLGKDELLIVIFWIWIWLVCGMRFWILVGGVLEVSKVWLELGMIWIWLFFWFIFLLFEEFVKLIWICWLFVDWICGIIWYWILGIVLFDDFDFGVIENICWFCKFWRGRIYCLFEVVVFGICIRLLVLFFIVVGVVDKIFYRFGVFFNCVEVKLFVWMKKIKNVICYYIFVVYLN